MKKLLEVDLNTTRSRIRPKDNVVSTNFNNFINSSAQLCMTWAYFSIILLLTVTGHVMDPLDLFFFFADTKQKWAPFYSSVMSESVTVWHTAHMNTRSLRQLNGIQTSLIFLSAVVGKKKKSLINSFRGRKRSSTENFEPICQPSIIVIHLIES